jgi:hypothetical protein
MSDIGSKESRKTENSTKLSSSEHSPAGNNVENSLNSSISLEITDIGKGEDANKTEMSIEKPSCSEALKTDVVNSAESQQSLSKAKTNDMSKVDSKSTPLDTNSVPLDSGVHLDKAVEAKSHQTSSSTTTVVDEIHDSTSKPSSSSPIHDSEMDNKLPENPLLLSEKENSAKAEVKIVSCDTKNESESDRKNPVTTQTSAVSKPTEAVPSTGETDQNSTDAIHSTEKTILNKNQATVPNDASKTIDNSPDTMSKSEVQMDEPHSAGKVTNRELSEKYAPFILPGDETLEDARNRLKIAIEQTRELRLSFTKNLYDKYRIVLRPVPKSADAIVSAIRAQPKVAHEKILQEMQMISTEKELEKRAAQKLNLDFANASTASDISTWLGGLQGVDNAEQLSWYGVGLYLVVLPEEDVNEADLVESGVTERGPIDPATGNKSKDLVQSAALASSSMLDRVRKAAELRRERLQNQDYTSMGDFSSDSNLVPFQPSFTTSRPLKKSPAIMTRAPPSGTKSQKNKPSSSLISLLNLSANAEGVRLNGKLSAPGFALNTCSLKSSSTRSRVQNRHPFPQSKGARSVTYGRSSGSFSAHPFSLPSLTTASERKTKVLSGDIDNVSETTLLTLKSVINPVLSSSTKNGENERTKMKRKFNEIRIVEELRNNAQSESKTQTEGILSKGVDATDPCLVLAVMKSLGLLVSSRKSTPKNGYNGNIVGLQKVCGEEKLDEVNSLNIIDDTILERVSKRQKRFSVSLEESRPNEEKDTKIEDMQCDHVTTDKSPVLTDKLQKNEQIPSSHTSSTKDLKNQYVPSLRGGGEVSKPGVQNSKSSISGRDFKQRVHSKDSSQQMMQPQDSSEFSASNAHTMMTLYQHGNNIGPIPANMNQVQGQHSVDGLGTVRDQRRLSSHTRATLSTNQIQQLQSASMQQNEIIGPSSTGVPSEYLNGMHQMQIQSFINHHGAEWASLASQHGVMSGPHPGSSFDPSAMGLSPHQAAMLVRDRAAQALFAREQQLHAQVAAAQHNASAYGMSQAVMMNPVTVPQYGFISPNTDTNLNLMIQGKQSNRPSESHSEVTKSTSSAPHPQSNGSEKTKKLSSSSSAQKDSKERESKILTRDQQDLERKPAKLPQQDEYKKSSSEDCNVSRPTGGQVTSANHEKTQPVGIASNVPCHSNTSNSKSSTTSNHVKIIPVKDIGHSATDSMSSTTKDHENVTSGKSVEIPTTDSKSSKIDPAIFVKPPHSYDLNETDAQKILSGLFHEITKPSVESKGAEKSGKEDYTKHRIEYLLKVSAAVPISKTFVLGLLKEKFIVPRLKAVMTSFSIKYGIASPMEVIVAVIVTWVWSNYRSLIEKVFEHNGRIDVDPRCNWIVKAAIESVTDEAVTKELNKFSSQSSSSEGINDTSESVGNILFPLAVLISKALNRSLSVNPEVNGVLSNYDVLVDYLDRLREKALRLRSQERVLMANLIAKRVRMSEAFSNAYTSSMVRAGNALGYDDLSEIVQDEETSSFSMLPFDILSDPVEAWEDPCRPLDGYSSNLDSDELLKKAHARAMIQRSLKKLQDRHNIKGGTQTAGPYSDAPDEQSAYDVAASPPPRPSPRSGIKRKLSSMSLGGENSIRGLDAAVSSVFNPGHFSAPFLWDKNSIGCSPYGRHDQNLKFAPSPNVVDEKREVQILQSSEAIDWQSVAALFEDVVHIEKSSSKVHDDHHNVAVPLGSNIIAPFCRKCDSAMAPSDVDSDSDNEDLDDEHILAAHTGVLDTIKEKFDTMMRIRQEYFDRSRRHSFGRT